MTIRNLNDKKANTAYPAVQEIARRGAEFNAGLQAFLQKRPPKFS